MKQISPFSQGGYSRNIMDVERIRPEIEDRIIEMMRDRGYLPVTDIDSLLETRYDLNTDRLYWEITMQGMYVGSKAKEHEGLWRYRPIGTHPSKQKQSSTT